MSHNLHITDQGRVSFAFVGSRNNIWHRLGNELQPGASREEWLKAAGLDFKVVQHPCVVQLPDGRTTEIPNRVANCRDDNHAYLGLVSRNKYHTVQPNESLDFCWRYVSVDSRFQPSAAGALGQGETIWATAAFNGDLTVAGEKHSAFLLFRTTFDATSPTVVQMTITRTVCANTLAVASADTRAAIRVRHSARFNADQVARELSQLAQTVETYKQVGDAMAQNEMAKAEISEFFKTLLEIPLEAKRDDISTRKLNQFTAMSDAYAVSVQEGAPANTAWSALQAVTRYVDHDRGGTRSDDAKFESAMFGSGADMKATAMQLLMPRIKDKVLISA